MHTVVRGHVVHSLRMRLCIEMYSNFNTKRQSTALISPTDLSQKPSE